MNIHSQNLLKRGHDASPSDHARVLFRDDVKLIAVRDGRAHQLITALVRLA
jgi:hypothetical protein